MTPDDYVRQLKLYARYVAQLQSRAAGCDAMQRIAVGPDGGDTVHRSGDEGLEEQDLELGHRGLSLHSYTVVKWPPAFKARRVRRERIRQC